MRCYESEAKAAHGKREADGDDREIESLRLEAEGPYIPREIDRELTEAACCCAKSE